MISYKYKCDICKSDKELDELFGAYSKLLHDIEIKKAEFLSNGAIHICKVCANVIKNDYLSRKT
jgi:hypothetical protein